MISNKPKNNTALGNPFKPLKLPCPFEITGSEPQSWQHFRDLFIDHRFLASGRTFRVTVISDKPPSGWRNLIQAAFDRGCPLCHLNVSRGRGLTVFMANNSIWGFYWASKLVFKDNHKSDLHGRISSSVSESGLGLQVPWGGEEISPIEEEPLNLSSLNGLNWRLPWHSPHPWPPTL